MARSKPTKPAEPLSTADLRHAEILLTRWAERRASIEQVADALDRAAAAARQMVDAARDVDADDA